MESFKLILMLCGLLRLTHSLQMSVSAWQTNCIYSSGDRNDQMMLSYTSKGFHERNFKIEVQDENEITIQGLDGKNMDLITHIFDKDNQEVKVCFTSLDQRSKTIDFSVKVVNPSSQFYMTGYEISGLQDRLYMVESKMNELSESFDSAKQLGRKHQNSIEMSKM